METHAENPTQEVDLSQVSTQELIDEAFSRGDIEETRLPKHVPAERGKHMKMNAKDETGEDNYVWPVIRVDKVRMSDLLQNAAEAYWRKHVNAFRQEKNEQIAHKHRNENTVGDMLVEISGEEKEIPIVEVSALNAGEITSQEQELMEAKQKIQQLVESGKITKEEAKQLLE